MSEKKLLLKKILDWILFVPFVLAFIIVLVLGEFLQRVALAFGRKAHAWSLRIVTFGLIFSVKLFGTKIRIKFPENFKLEEGKPYIIVSNHQSTIDIVLLYHTFGKNVPHFVAKKELGRFIPTVSFNLRCGHNVLIDRDNPRQSIKAIAEFGKIISEYKYLGAIFPEGTRSRCGELKEFQPAGVSTLLKYAPQADIIPVAISNSWKLNPHSGVPGESFQTLSITVGNVIKRAQGMSGQEVVVRCYDFVKDNIGK